MSREAVLITRRLPSSVIATLEKGCDVDIHREAGAMPREELLARVRGKQGLICVLTDRIDAELLDAGRDLRIVADIAVGYDNIDVAAARAHGVIVTNTPDVLTEATAELTWTLILGIARRVVEGDRLIRRGGWKGFALDFMLGTELSGKQLGVVGFGRIGRAVARRAAAFNMHVVVASRTRRNQPQARASDAGGAATLSFDELLVTSDVISLHVPLSDQTRHLIDRRALARMKRTAYLVNTSRGAVVDEEALAWALTEGLIAGAALDVFEHEPNVHPALLGLENVLLVPHLGSATRETRTAMADLAARNVLAVLRGGTPPTRVTPL